MQPSLAARPALFARDGNAFLAKDFFRLGHVAFGFLKSLFAVHHPCASFFAQGFDNCRVDLRGCGGHFSILVNAV